MDMAGKDYTLHAVGWSSWNRNKQVFTSGWDFPWPCPGLIWNRLPVYCWKTKKDAPKEPLTNNSNSFIICAVVNY
jgi:hypothetical protein